ncbi:hypothetical protein DPMN_187730 [Dreissena polymorpha]|uniref:Uncharacterized protein n=1 Tax=Dreissena polymorpha TaxID=45954 RepID=A0A9D4I9B3_DREPO|nr:hypothetical protein DPMN_187730 [Dreissena polymorpha]
MLAEYLSGGLRVFAGLVKVCRREDKLSVRRLHSPKTNFFVREWISEGARGSPTSTAPLKRPSLAPLSACSFPLMLTCAGHHTNVTFKDLSRHC